MIRIINIDSGDDFLKKKKYAAKDTHTHPPRQKKAKTNH